MKGREIKFRAWHIKNNEMVYFNPDKKDPYISAYFYELIHGNCTQGEMMQFTGMQDENGKDICEGDIVTCKMSFEGGSLPHQGEIVYLDNFGAFATRNESGDTLLHNHLLNTFEIVGNIFES